MLVPKRPNDSGCNGIWLKIIPFNTLLPSQYEHIAVVFKVPEPAELTRRLASRPGKVIPAEVMENMIRNFEPPSLDEGFKEIWVVGE